MTTIVTSASLMVAVVGESHAAADRTVGVRSRGVLEDHQHTYAPTDARRVALAMVAAAAAIDGGVELGLPTLDGSATEDDVDAYIAAHRPLEAMPAIATFAIPPDVAERHRPALAHFTASGHAAMGREEIDAAAAAGRTVDVCSCDEGSGCDVMRILLAGSRLD